MGRRTTMGSGGWASGLQEAQKHPALGGCPLKTGGRKGQATGQVERLAKWSSSLEPPNIPQIHLGARLRLGQTARTEHQAAGPRAGMRPGRENPERILTGAPASGRLKAGQKAQHAQGRSANTPIEPGRDP